MKPKRSLDEAVELFKKGNKDPNISDFFFDSLCGTTKESKARTDTLDFKKEYITLLGLEDSYSRCLVSAMICTLIDVGTVVGRLMYEDLPSELDLTEVENEYIN